MEKEFERMVAEDILQPVEFVNWASPIVAVLKKDGTSIHIGETGLLHSQGPSTGNLHASLNSDTLTWKYHWTTPPRNVIVNTHKGLFRFTRLLYGISSAPGIFQRVM